MMIDPSLVPILRPTLPVRDYWDPQHKTIAAAIYKLSERDDPVDMVGVLLQMRRFGTAAPDTQVYLRALIKDGIATTESAIFYARKVKDCAVRRAIMQTADKIYGMAADPTVDQSELVGRIDKMIQAATIGAEPAVALWQPDYVTRYMERLRLMSDHPRIRLPFPKLSRSIGGLQPGGLYVIGGRPKHGKTLFALAFASVMAMGEPIAYCALEEGGDAMVARQLAAVAGIESGAVMSGELTEAEWAAIMVDGVADELRKRNLILIGDDQRIGVAELRAILRTEKARRGLAAVVVDHSGMITDTHDTREHDRVTYAINAAMLSLKRMARELDVPVIVLVHFSTKADKRGAKGPRAEDVADSDSYGRHAMALVGVWQPAKYDKNQDPKLLRLRVLLNRYGAAGDIDYHVEWAHGTVTEEWSAPDGDAPEPRSRTEPFKDAPDLSPEEEVPF
jgi:replicative DNA helicase